MSSAKPNADFGFCSVVLWVLALHPFIHSFSPLFAHNSGWDIHYTPYFKELSISNRANGYQDIVARIDLSTYRRLPWENNVPFFLISFAHPEDGKPLIACARSILDGVVKRFEEGEQALQCLAGAEFEVSLKCSTGGITRSRAHRGSHR